MARVLTDDDVASFRDRLCRAAEVLFAQKGAEAVTMREIAGALGVSPMTPYRYFKDKDDILAAVRAQGFNAFAVALKQARRRAKTQEAKAHALGDAYVRFAYDHPQTYRLMFDFDQASEADHPELTKAGRRARRTLSAWVEDQVKAGDMAGDPARIWPLFWAATHGAVVLEMTGRLPEGAAETLQRQISTALMKGLKPGA